MNLALLTVITKKQKAKHFVQECLEALEPELMLEKSRTAELHGGPNFLNIDNQLMSSYVSELMSVSLKEILSLILLSSDFTIAFNKWSILGDLEDNIQHIFEVFCSLCLSQWHLNTSV